MIVRVVIMEYQAKIHPMRNSEARVLVFLSQVKHSLQYAREISLKVRIDYSYTLLILKILEDRGWIKQKKSIANPTKKFYELEPSAPLEEAKKKLEKI